MSSSKRRTAVVSLSLSHAAVAALDARVAAGEAESRTALVERWLVGEAPAPPADEIAELRGRVERIERRPLDRARLLAQILAALPPADGRAPLSRLLRLPSGADAAFVQTQDAAGAWRWLAIAEGAGAE